MKLTSLTACIGLSFATCLPAAARQDPGMLAAAIEHAAGGRDFTDLILDMPPGVREDQDALLRATVAILSARVSRFEDVRTCEPPLPWTCTLTAGSTVAVVVNNPESPATVSTTIWRNGAGRLRGSFHRVRMERDPAARHGWKVAEVLTVGAT